MLCPDVNVLVHAFRVESPRHQEAARWLTSAGAGGEPVGLLPVVLSGFLRIVTNRRIFAEPDTCDDALAFLDVLLSRPRVMVADEGAPAWTYCRAYVEDAALVGDDVPDAFIAGAVMSVRGQLVTYDRGFSRFPGLHVLIP